MVIWRQLDPDAPQPERPPRVLEQAAQPDLDGDAVGQRAEHQEQVVAVHGYFAAGKYNS